MSPRADHTATIIAAAGRAGRSLASPAGTGPAITRYDCRNH